MNISKFRKRYMPVLVGIKYVLLIIAIALYSYAYYLSPANNLHGLVVGCFLAGFVVASAISDFLRGMP